jgi:hypothetical protein
MDQLVAVKRSRRGGLTEDIGRYVDAPEYAPKAGTGLESRSAPPSWLSSLDGIVVRCKS